MSYLKRPTLTLVLNRFKTSAEGWRSGRATMTVDMSARRELLERLENESKACMEATLGPRIFPRDRNVQQLYAHCALNTSFYPFHCAIIALPLSRDMNVQQLIVLSIGVSILFIAHAIIALPLRFVGLFALILYVHTALPLRLWRSWFISRCCSDAFNCFTMHSCYDFTSAWPFLPRYIVLVRAPTRCACFKHT